MRRMLTNKEKSLTSKVIVKDKENLEILNGELKKTNFYLDFLLEHNYKLKIKELQLEKQKIEGTTKMLTKKIKILEEQITKGVEAKVKPKTEEK